MNGINKRNPPYFPDFDEERVGEKIEFSSTIRVQNKEDIWVEYVVRKRFSEGANKDLIKSHLQECYNILFLGNGEHFNNHSPFQGTERARIGLLIKRLVEPKDSGFHDNTDLLITL